jgi:Icc protein
MRVSQISDLHLVAERGRRVRGADTWDALETALDRLRQEDCDLVLATGDLSHDGTAASYARLRERLALLDRPIQCLAGNHDAPAEMASTLEGDRIRRDRVILLGTAWQIVTLDSCVEGKAAGRLRSSELDRLDAALEGSGGRFTLVALHHPVLSDCASEGCRLECADGLLSRLDATRGLRGVVWGHAHDATDTMRSGVRLLGAPSTAFRMLHTKESTRWSGSPSEQIHRYETRGRGFRRLLLRDDGCIETEVVWLDGEPVA